MKRPQITVDVNGVPMSLRELAQSHGLKVRTVLSRYWRTKRLDVAELTRPAEAKYARRGSW